MTNIPLGVALVDVGANLAPLNVGLATAQNLTSSAITTIARNVKEAMGSAVTAVGAALASNTFTASIATGIAAAFKAAAGAIAAAALPITLAISAAVVAGVATGLIDVSAITNRLEGVEKAKKAQQELEERFRKQRKELEMQTREMQKQLAATKEISELTLRSAQTGLLSARASAATDPFERLALQQQIAKEAGSDERSRIFAERARLEKQLESLQNNKFFGQVEDPVAIARTRSSIESLSAALDALNETADVLDQQFAQQVETLKKDLEIADRAQRVAEARLTIEELSADFERRLDIERRSRAQTEELRRLFGGDSLARELLGVAEAAKPINGTSGFASLSQFGEGSATNQRERMIFFLKSTDENIKAIRQQNKGLAT